MELTNNILIKITEVPKKSLKIPKG